MREQPASGQEGLSTMLKWMAQLSYGTKGILMALFGNKMV
jgi:hypothetical protein